MKFKSLTVMPDFCSSGIWDGINGVMIDFEDLNMPEKLITEFESWIMFYDIKCHTQKIEFKLEMADELNKQGRELAKKLKKLLPDIKISYKGEIKGRMLKEEEIV